MRSARIEVSSEIDLLKIEMILKRLNSRQLAGRSGVHLRVVQNILSGQNRDWPPRAAINQALGKRIFTKQSPARPKPPEIPQRTEPPTPANRMMNPNSVVTRARQPKALHEND